MTSKSGDRQDVDGGRGRDSPVHAVRRGDDPMRSHDGASTQVLAAEVQAHLPGELTRPGDVAPDDTGVEARPGAAL